MRKDFSIEGVGTLSYEESDWTGKKQLFVNGKEAKKLDKKTFELDGVTFRLEGSYLAGLSLDCNGKRYELFAKTKWYEYALAFLPFIFVIIWGNIPSLVAVFPIVGGAIGGAVSGAVAIGEIAIMRKIKNPLVKVAVSLAAFAVTVLLLFVLAIALLSAV